MYCSRLRKVLLAVSVLTVTVFSGCGTVYVDPPFNGGIRIITLETSLELALEDIPVPGVTDQGALQSILGPGSGTQTIFDGITNGQGYDDHTNARTNASWLFVADYTAPSPDCGVVSANDTIPAAGAEHSFHCIL